MENLRALDAIFLHANEGMLFLNSDQTISQVSVAFEQQTGLSAKIISTKKIQDVFSGGDDGDFFEEVAAHLLGEEVWKGELRCLDENDITREFKASILPLNLDENGPRYLVILNSQLNKLDSETQTLKSNFDELTDLPGVNIFLDRVDQALVNSRRQKQLLALLLINIDRFSLINDGLGHDFGDLVLKEIAKRLKDSLRESDTVARIAGDSFALLVKVTAEDHAALVSEKILKIINNPMMINNQKIVLTASIGIINAHDEKISSITLMDNSESALHRAKKHGGNSFHFFANDLNQIAKERIDLENNLRHGLENDEFLLYYQPKVRITTNKIVGMEALIRWERPGHGMVAPFKFIPVAEETGLIIDIGCWVLHEACRQNQEWQSLGLPALPVAVNVSPRQFQSNGFSEEVLKAIEKSGLKPEYLELEITESMLMSEIEQTITKLKDLVGIGLTMAIDDFGTGYSNLSYLNRFPVSTLKIDRAFIKDVELDANNAKLTESIINMSHSLNLEIVAEGAENKEHIDFLESHNCDKVQGYYYSKPLPAGEFKILLEKGVIDDSE